MSEQLSAGTPVEVTMHIRSCEDCAAKDAEIVDLRCQRDRLINRVDLLAKAVGIASAIKPDMVMRPGDPVGMMLEVVEHCKRIAALTAERDGLAAALHRSYELATIAATREVEAAISHEPGTDVFGAVGIASKSRVARAKAAWKALDDCIGNPAAILAARDERMKREGAAAARKNCDKQWIKALESVRREMGEGVQFDNPFLAAAARKQLAALKAEKGGE